VCGGPPVNFALPLRRIEKQLSQAIIYFDVIIFLAVVWIAIADLDKPIPRKCLWCYRPRELASRSLVFETPSTSKLCNSVLHICVSGTDPNIFAQDFLHDCQEVRLQQMIADLDNHDHPAMLA
jgi:hypothetical protein